MSRLSTAALIARIAQDAQGLVKAEIQLAKAELRADVSGLLAGVRRTVVAGGFLLAALLVLLMAAVLALTTLMAAWLAALIVAGALLVCGGLAVAWARAARPRAALARTRRNLQELKEELPWTKTKSG